MTRAHQKQPNSSIFGTKKKSVQYYRKPKLKNRKMKPPCGHKRILPAMLKNHWSHWNTKVFSRIYFRVKCKGFTWGSLTPIPNSSLSGQKRSPIPRCCGLRKCCLKYIGRKKCIWNAETEWLTFRFLPLNSHSESEMPPAAPSPALPLPTAKWTADDPLATSCRL